MNTPLPIPARRILATLLDRYEQPNRLRVVRVRLAADTDAEYFAAHDAEPRIQTNEALKALAGGGVLRLHWQKWEEDNWLAAVDLIPETAARLYALLERPRHTDQSDALQVLLHAQTRQSGWHDAFLSLTLAQLAARRSVTPLTLGDEPWNRDLLRALDALARLQHPTLERTLSVEPVSGRNDGRSKGTVGTPDGSRNTSLPALAAPPTTMVLGSAPPAKLTCEPRPGVAMKLSEGLTRLVGSMSAAIE